MLRALPALLVAGLVAASCGPGREEGLSGTCRRLLAGAAPAPTPSPAGVVDSRLECGPNEIRVAGALRGRIAGPVLVRIAEIYGGRAPRVTWFLSGATAQQLTLPDGTTLTVAFDVAPGEYRGDGTYTIAAGPGPEVARGVRSPLRSDALVRAINPAASPPSFAEFSALLAPCRLLVSDHGSRGLLRCPRLGDGNGREVSLQWSWRTRRPPPGPQAHRRLWRAPRGAERPPAGGLTPAAPR